MAHVIAIAGKGGVGKTTLSGLLIQAMCKLGKHRFLQSMQTQTRI